MATPPSFTAGSVLTAAQMNAVGLWLVKSQAVSTSGVTSVTLTNVFSSDFDAYRVIYSGGTLSTNDIGARFGPSSVSGYNTGYYSTLFYANGNPGTFTLAQTQNQAEMAWLGGGSTTTAYATFDIINPYKATWTRFHNGSYQNNLNVGFTTGEHRSTGQFTDITIIGGGGATITGGTVRVYGYRN